MLLKPIIKIPGINSFTELTIDQVALMIEADSSLQEKGNEFFASCALDEFLNRDLSERSDLKAIQTNIIENIYIDVEGQVWKEINVNFLQSYAKELKNRGTAT